MKTQLPSEPPLQRLVNEMRKGNRNAFAELFTHFSDRLWRIVSFRLDQRLRGRVDADDVIQETYLAAEKRLEYFTEDGVESFFVWLRLVLNQTLIDLHRRHLGAQSRDASRDRSIHGGWPSESTSFSLSFHLLGHLTSPSQATLRVELSEQLRLALAGMSDLDREVLALRHFEELSNSETARVLQLSDQAASIRYVRAITRLRKVLEAIPGFLDHGSEDAAS